MNSALKPRNTEQLRVVWEAVALGKGHPTAETVFRRARKRLPKISMGTVYRNLQKLVRERRLLVIRAPDGVQRFDARTDAHDHFVCQRCGEVVDVPLMSGIEAPNLEAMGYVVSDRLVTWIGLCPHCRERSGSAPA
ncbi:MAG: transcriptional repressor [Candidatus Binatia bacterium]|nr:transcriptional repressor [Candidatus Binatia bacterium]